ncbi:MAG: PEP-CTERM sorting domain-containing protein [Nostocaceae cyanobacterium]|nr:PEP-CTERM sorting domain-containing protein [Nostocaceae cyanobacterium]
MINLKRISTVAVVTAIATMSSFTNINSAKAATFEYEDRQENIFFDRFDISLTADKNPISNPEYKIDNLWESYGVKMRTNLADKKLWLYDSYCKPGGGTSFNGFSNTCTGGDKDLATGKGSYTKNGSLYDYESPGQGKVLIIQENGNQTPDDNGSGGKIILDFTDKNNGVLFQELGFLDFDENKEIKFNFTFIDDSKQTLTFNGDDRSNPMAELLSTDHNGNELIGDNSQWKFKFDFDKRVTKAKVILPGSGAITYFKYERKTKRRVPEPTSALGVVVGLFGGVSLIKRKGK